jgi:hypothetical protein
MTETPTPTPPPPPLDHAHHAPPDHIRAFHKKLQRANKDSLLDIDVLAFDLYDAAAEDPLHRFPEYHRKRLKLEATIPKERLNSVLAQFGGEDAVQADVPIFTHNSVPGMSSD